MGYRTAVLDPDRRQPGRTDCASPHPGALTSMPARSPSWPTASDAVTTEFENVPAEALTALARRRRVAPAGDAVAVCQDRAAEKAHFVRCDVPCAPHAVIERAEQIAALDADALLPGILKTARLGYDGKGQARVVRSGRARGGLGASRARHLRARADAAARRRAQRHRRARSRWRQRRLAGAAEPAPRRHPRGHARAGARCRPGGRRSRRRCGPARRRIDRLRRRAVRRVLPARRRQPSSPTRWRRGRTTPATTASTPATSRSSSCRSAR